MAGQLHALRRHAVQVGRVDLLLAIGAEIPGPQGATRGKVTGIEFVFGLADVAQNITIARPL